MMLANPFHATMPYHPPYSPPRPSPLSERSINTAPRLFSFSMTSQQSEKKPPIPQRAFKPNPVIQTRDAATKRRRDMFFRRVQDNRENKKWEARGEQIQQLDFMTERKQWEAQKAREAPPQDDSFEEDIEEDEVLPCFPSYATQYQDDFTEADRMAAQEDFDLQQLIASMEQESDAKSQHYGSDDDDYDSIFMECAATIEQQYQQSTDAMFDGTDSMDMDMTDG